MNRTYMIRSRSCQVIFLLERYRNTFVSGAGYAIRSRETITTIQRGSVVSVQSRTNAIGSRHRKHRSTSNIVVLASWLNFSTRRKNYTVRHSIVTISIARIPPVK
jgi:hypothetical protein